MDYFLYYRYNGEMETIILGEEKDWLEKHRFRLHKADLIELGPKKGKSLPSVQVHLRPGRRWVCFSRVFKDTGSSRQVRLYCIGWQETVNGKNVKFLNWIYPGGAVEVADEPVMVHDMMGGVKNGA